MLKNLKTFRISPFLLFLPDFQGLQGLQGLHSNTPLVLGSAMMFMEWSIIFLVRMLLFGSFRWTRRSGWLWSGVVWSGVCWLGIVGMKVIWSGIQGGFLDLLILGKKSVIGEKYIISGY